MGKRLLAVGALLVLASQVYADLQNVDVGGEIRIRGRYWRNYFTEPGAEIRIPNFFLPGRPIGATGVSSRNAYDSKTNGRHFVEQSTKLNVNADFTNNVRAFIELEDYERWGETDFRSNYITGADARAVSGDDVEIIQSYIETSETFGLPLRLRIGRQQIKLGSGWLVGETQSAVMQAFDGIRATYEFESVTLDAWWTKLFEGGINEEDEDIDFYGLSATCTALEGHEFMAYWLYVRDARSLNDTNFIAPIEWLEDLVNLDDYDPTNLHTVGVYGVGTIGHFDYALEAAYQFGNADAVGQTFAPVNEIYGDHEAEFDNWAAELEVGYTFETAWNPRVFVKGSYFGGDENRDLSFWEWINPFDRPDSSIAFNRLFNSTKDLELLDDDRNVSNFNQIRVGAEVQPTEAVSVEAWVSKLAANEAFDRPWMINVGGFDIPMAPALPFLTTKSDEDYGYVTSLTLVYDYSEDLSIKFMWQHLFADDNIDQGNFLLANGLQFVGGSDSDDCDYFAFDTRLKF